MPTVCGGAVSEKKDTKNVTMPRTFASPAYLREIEPRTYMLYRDIVVEVKDEKGEKMREKHGDLCMSPFPLREFDPSTDDECQVVLESYHPVENRPMRLVEVHRR